MGKYYRLLFVLVCLVCPTSLWAAEKNSCFSCHEKASFTGKVVHKPLVSGKCTDCHNPHVAHFKGLLDQQGAGLCYSCHKDEENKFSSGRVHQPVRHGECLSCHEPHAGQNAGLIKGKLAAICLDCHKEQSEKYKYTHAPYSKGNCSACHDPHQSTLGQLLVKEGDSLCFSCHNSAAVKKAHPDYPDVLKNCLSCHNPHGSDRKFLVRNVLHPPYAKGCNDCHGESDHKNGNQSCLKCHKEVEGQMFAAHSHLASSSKGNSCVACHSPHAADEKGLLKGSQAQVCSKCHEDTMGRFADSLYKHQNAEKCTECHEVHGSNRLAMLIGDGNTVCTRCHETQGEFTHPVGEKVIDPRTGTMVTCLTCHNPMGTDFKYELIYSGSKDLCVQCHKSY